MYRCDCTYFCPKRGRFTLSQALKAVAIILAIATVYSITAAI